MFHDIEWRHARAWVGRRLILKARWLDFEAGTPCRVMCVVDFGDGLLFWIRTDDDAGRDIDQVTRREAVSPQVLAEFAHVVTDPRRFERPLDMDGARELCEQWWNAEECRPVHSDYEAGALFLTWLDEFRPGRKRLLDTLLAASLHCAGVRRVATTDWRDFETYGVFEVLRLAPD